MHSLANANQAPVVSATVLRPENDELEGRSHRILLLRHWQPCSGDIRLSKQLQPNQAEGHSRKTMERATGTEEES